jgi:DNA-binding transcriptional MerR regulator
MNDEKTLEYAARVEARRARANGMELEGALAVIEELQAELDELRKDFAQTKVTDIDAALKEAARERDFRIQLENAIRFFTSELRDTRSEANAWIWNALEEAFETAGVAIVLTFERRKP